MGHVDAFDVETKRAEMTCFDYENPFTKKKKKGMSYWVKKNGLWSEVYIIS